MRLLSTAALAATMFGAMACDPGAKVSYENRSDSTAIIYFDGWEEARLLPDEVKSKLLFRFPRVVTYVLVDTQGRSVETGTLRWEGDKLKKLIVE